MKENNSDLSPLKSNGANLLLVPDYFLETIINRQDKILNLLSNREIDTLNGFITEKKAKEILCKKTTWFWQMRKNGQLSFKKIGQTIYYSLSDINKLLKESH
jgi:hypothetical protein